MSVTISDFGVDDRSWDLGPHGSDPGSNPNATFVVANFDAEDHYPNGYLPSGIVVSRLADDTYGPYDGALPAAGHVFAAVPVLAGVTRVAGALKVHGFVDPTRLPIQSGDGALTDEARVDLIQIHYSDKPTVIPSGGGSEG